MAEEAPKAADDKKQKKGIVRRLIPARARNRLFNLSNRLLGTSFHEIKPEEQPITILDVYEQLQRELNFEHIRDLNNLMIRFERFWDGGTPESDATSAATIRDEVREFYRSLGHFCDITALEKEHGLVGVGIPIGDYESKEIKIQVPNRGETILRFRVPKAREITFNHGLSYKVVYFGTEEQIAPELTRDFDAYFNTLLDEITQLNIGDETKTKITYIIKKYRRVTQIAMENIGNYLKQFETKHREFMSSLSAKKGAYTTLQSRVINRRMEPKWVQYRHTYKIIRTEVRDKLRTLGTFWKEPEEIDFGLDENGWPLEVAEKDYVYVKQRLDGSMIEENIPEGTVLLDVFNNKPRRRVVPNTDEYTDYCDLLDMSAWVYVNYDAVRDDLRDGRYHDNSLSIMEYLLPRIPVEYLQFNHESLEQPISNNTRHTTTRMKLNSPPGRPGNVNWAIKPTHLNQAFDLRRDFKFRSLRDIHLGRKYYYELQEHCAEKYQSKNPTMTTRGAAMWILARVIERAKYWDETIQLLEKIGGDIDGYDIGPNIQVSISVDAQGERKPVPARWGKTLSRNPFRPITGAGWK